MKAVIFENRMSAVSWFVLAMGYIAASAVVIMGGRNVAFGLIVIGGVAVATALIIVTAVAALASRQLAMLTLEDGMLEAERFSLFGRGKRFSFPATEASKWRWKTRPARGVKYGVLAFSYRGDEYTMAFSGAKVKDYDAFKVIAPFLLWA